MLQTFKLVGIGSMNKMYIPIQVDLTRCVVHYILNRPPLFQKKKRKEKYGILILRLPIIFFFIMGDFSLLETILFVPNEGIQSIFFENS